MTRSEDSNSAAATERRSSAAEDERQMIALSILRFGRYFYYEGYRYESLKDAIAYAAIVRSRRARRANPPWLTPLESVGSTNPALPDDADPALMTEFAISFEEGRWTFEGFHYNRLVDAANYARHLRDSTPDAT